MVYLDELSPGLFLLITLAAAVCGFLIARLAWFERLNLLIRLPLWVALTICLSLAFWIAIGVVAHGILGELGDVVSFASGDFSLFFQYILEVGAETAFGSLAGIGLWVVLQSTRGAVHLYENRHIPGGILDRAPPPKRWRVAFFVSGLWAIFVFIHAMLFDRFDWRWLAQDVVELLFSMLGPALLGLVLFWIYERFVK